LLTLIKNMTTETIVKDPARMTTSEVEQTLADIIAYEAKTGESWGVLKSQSRQLGAIHYLTSQKDAKKDINMPVSSNPRTCEWGIKFYSRSYFENRIKE